MADIFDEVAEDLRRERLKKVWDKFAPIIIGVAVLIVVGIGGWRLWEHYQRGEAASSGDRYTAAMQLAEKGQHEDAAAAFTTLAQDGTSGYRTLARLRAAAEIALRDPKAAITAFDSFAADNAEPAGMRDVARIRAGYLLVDDGTYAEAQQRVGSLAVAGNPLRHSAREILGLSAWKNGDNAEARKWLQEMVADPEAAAGFRQRGDLILGMITSNEAPPAPPGPAPSSATTPSLPALPLDPNVMMGTGSFTAPNAPELPAPGEGVPAAPAGDAAGVPPPVDNPPVQAPGAPAADAPAAAPPSSPVPAQ